MTLRQQTSLIHSVIAEQLEDFIDRVAVRKRLYRFPSVPQKVAAQGAVERQSK